MAMPMEVLCQNVAAAKMRLECSARGPLAGVDGFRTVVGLVLEHMFGIRWCPRCPDCDCADLAG
eukprot:6152038-Pyramimonas_sp.AAC.1